MNVNWNAEIIEMMEEENLNLTKNVLKTDFLNYHQSNDLMIKASRQNGKSNEWGGNHLVKDSG